MKRTIEPGNITETIFLNGFRGLSPDSNEKLLNYLTDFCVDSNGNIRKSRGLISCGGQQDNDFNYVPQNRYQSKASHWTSHCEYLEIELPNPATESALYVKIRAAFIAEIEKRLNIDLRKIK